MTALARDLRIALRSLRKSPAVTLTIVLTLALAVGANTALFTYLGHFLWPTVDAPDPEELVSVQGGTEQAPGGPLSYPDLRDLEDRGDLFERVAGALTSPAVVGVGDQSLFAWAYMVGGDYFALFDKAPRLGRWLGPADDRPGAERSIVLSHPFWRRHFGADPDVVGRTVTIGGRHAYTVVGVAGEGFQGHGLAQNVYVPLAHWPDLAQGLGERSRPRVPGFARLRDGVSREAAEDALAAFSRGLDERVPLPSGHSRRLVLEPLAGLDAAWEDGVTRRARILAAVVALLLVLAAANIANLLLARAAGRRREMAMRAALGAGRWRLVRPLVLEGLVLAVAGGVLGTVLAWWGVMRLETLLRVVPAGFGPWGEGSTVLAFDHRMLAFALVAAVATTLLFTAAPAAELLRRDLMRSLRSDAARGAGGSGRDRAGGPRRLLVVVQVALGVTLLLAATLLGRSLHEIGEVDPGFDTGDLLLASLHLPGESAGRRGLGEEQLRHYERAVQRVGALPGVERACLVGRPPLFGGAFGERVRIEGSPTVAGEIPLAVNMVGPEYFATLGIPVVRGRGFEPSDRAGAPPVAVVNQTLAERFWPDEEPLGRSLALAEGRSAEEAGRVHEVVGVVADTRYSTLMDPLEPLAYFPVAQRPLRRMTIMVRTGQPSTVADSLWSVLSDRSTGGAVIELVPLEDQVRRSLFEQRLHLEVAAVIGVLGLGMAALGLAALIVFSVHRRRREIAVRMALGAAGREVVGLVLRESAALVIAGLALGGLGAVAVGRWLGSLLYGVAFYDPLATAGVVLSLAMVALLAALIPARRAARIDPARALHGE